MCERCSSHERVYLIKFYLLTCRTSPAKRYAVSVGVFFAKSRAHGSAKVQIAEGIRRHARSAVPKGWPEASLYEHTRT